MKPVPILNASRGLDVLSLEGDLPQGSVRVADNVLLHDNGGVERRPGYALDLSLADADSLYVAKQRAVTLVKAGSDLVRLTGVVGALEASTIATDLAPGPASYAEQNGSIYVSAGKLLRLDPDDVVRAPGVAAMMGFPPALREIAGSLAPGRYGVAVAAINDRGEESGLTSASWIDITSGGIRVYFTGFPAAGVTSWRVYRTPTNGEQFYLAADVASDATTFSIVGGDGVRAAQTWLHDLLPAGNPIFFFTARLYSVLGSFLYYSTPFAPGLYQVREGWLPMDGVIATAVPVDEGIFVCTETETVFLRGNSPTQFQVEVPLGLGAFPGSGALVDAGMFHPELVQGSKQVAVWLSPRGYVLGLANGQVIAPQADRMTLGAIGRANTAAFTRGGIKQFVCAVDALTVGSGGAADSTP